MSNAVPEVPDEGGLAERVKAKTKQIIGSVIADEDLKAEGELQEAKADAAVQAREDAASAEVATAKADIETRTNELRVERAQIAAEEAEAIERARLERETAVAEARVEKSAAVQEAAAQRQATAQEAAVDAKETRAVMERLEAEADVQEIERRAEQARRNAAALDNAQNTRS